MKTLSLKSAWEQLNAQAEQPLRIREAAKKLGISELELLLAEPKDVVPLKPEFEGILEQISTWGKVMALTRNEEVVHERKGVYPQPQFGPHASLFVSADIDLRLFMKSWAHAFAVTVFSRGKERKSIQFFNPQGEAIHKIYLLEESNLAAFETTVSTFRAEELPSFVPTDAKLQRTGQPLPQERLEDFQKDWKNLKDTHDFYMLFGKYRIDRLEALNNAPEGFAQKLDNQSVRVLLNLAAERQIPIMVFVGNPGMIQIHTGTVNNIVDYKGWINVMDPEFNLHVDEAQIHASWYVKKPTEDGPVNALEVYNAKGELILSFFGARKPGKPELPEWTQLLKDLRQSNV